MKYLALFFAFACAGLSTDASAATYNFYFNNTEQGPNSKASPSLRVTPSAGAKNASQSASEEVALPDQSQSSASGSAVLSKPLPDSAIIIPETESSVTPASWRLSAGAAWMDGTGRYRAPPSLQLGASFQFSRVLGSALHVGQMVGAGLELHPFGQRRGDGQLNAWLEAGVANKSWNSRAYSNLERWQPYFGASLGFGFLHGLAGVASYHFTSFSTKSYYSRPDNAFRASLAYLF